MVNHIPLFLGRIRRINQRQLFEGLVNSSSDLIKRKVAHLQDTKVEFALSVGTYYCSLVWLCCRDRFQRLGSDGVEYRKRKVVPVDDNSKVVPAVGGEWGGE